MEVIDKSNLITIAAAEVSRDFSCRPDGSNIYELELEQPTISVIHSTENCTFGNLEAVYYMHNGRKAPTRLDQCTWTHDQR